MSCRYLLSTRNKELGRKEHICVLREDDKEVADKMHKRFIKLGFEDDPETNYCPLAEKKKWTKCKWFVREI